jgi:hypothetical protein
MSLSSWSVRSLPRQHGRPTHEPRLPAAPAAVGLLRLPTIATVALDPGRSFVGVPAGNACSPATAAPAPTLHAFKGLTGDPR